MNPENAVHKIGGHELTEQDKGRRVTYVPGHADGVVPNRKPYYIELVDLLLRGSADEREAWRTNMGQLQARIDTIKQHKLKMKTKKGWDASNLSLSVYMKEPTEIDEEMYMYISEVVAPHYLRQDLTQGGDPYGAMPAEDGTTVFTYMTVSEVNGKYFYLGILPEFKQ